MVNWQDLKKRVLDVIKFDRNELILDTWYEKSGNLRYSIWKFCLDVWKGANLKLKPDVPLVKDETLSLIRSKMKENGDCERKLKELQDYHNIVIDDNVFLIHYCNLLREENSFLKYKLISQEFELKKELAESDEVINKLLSERVKKLMEDDALHKMMEEVGKIEKIEKIVDFVEKII